MEYSVPYAHQLCLLCNVGYLVVFPWSAFIVVPGQQEQWPHYALLPSPASCSLEISPHSPWFQLTCPFYVGCSLFAPWDSLSDYVHPGIACLAIQAWDWAGAFWVNLWLASLSGVHEEEWPLQCQLKAWSTTCNCLDVLLQRLPGLLQDGQPTVMF